MLGRLLILILIGIATASGQEAPAQFYINRGVVTNAQVNARNFINDGTFLVSTFTTPWDSQNTINFTNRGVMSGSMGFRFDLVEPVFGFRSSASNFFNAPGASIVASDAGGIIPFVSGTFVSTLFEPDVSFLTLNAMNVTNYGDLTVGANGLMQLFARKMDLSGGTLIVEDVNSAISGFGTFFIDVTETNFFPALGVYDTGWGINSTTNMSVSSIVASANPNVIVTPPFNITNFFSGTFSSSCQTFLVLTNAQVWVRDQRLNLTNRVIQLVAVDRVDTNISVFASFYPFVFPRGNPQGGFLSPLVEFRVASTNFRTFAQETNSFYVFNQLGSQTNYTLLDNLVERTFRPAPFVLFRSGSGLGEFGIPADFRILFPDIFDNPIYTNRFVTNQYAVYAAQIESLARRVPSLPDIGVTNYPGRVEIKADELLMDSTRIRGEGLISLSSSNLIGGRNSVLDTSRLNMNFSTRSNVLELFDMTPDRVERFGGFLQVFSTIWTNIYDEVSGTNTNSVEVRFELLAINADDLHTTEPLVAHELRLTSTNAGTGRLVYQDNLSVTNLLEINANEVTFARDSRLYLGRGVGLSYTNLVNISTFTNLGYIQANELADLRRTETTGYNRFVNHGTIVAYGTDISTDYFENSGSIISSNYYGYGFDSGIFFNTDCFGRPVTFVFSAATEGAISINANTAKIDAGEFTTIGDIRFLGGTFKFNKHRATSGARLVFEVRDILTDSGEDADNRWISANGFNLSGFRPTGDLLGTTIESFAPVHGFADHFWSAQDRGPSVAGFSNNLAIGRLRLAGGDGSTLRFRQGFANSALYVDVMQIDGFQANSLRDFTNGVRINFAGQGINIYYGNVESTNANFTAERLNRILGPNSPFNFIWVTNWAGPNSGVDVPLTENGPVRRFNRALRESVNFDSDGDGLPNRFDPFPFPAEAFGITGITLNSVSKVVTFGINVKEKGLYQIEYATNLIQPNWQPLSQLLQNEPNGGILSFTDELKAGSPQRYYRVRKAP
jgi:hypothetical protein